MIKLASLSWLSFLVACSPVELPNGDHLDVYGTSGNALGNEELTVLKKRFDEQVKSGEREIDSNTAYATVFCPKTLYGSFPSLVNENYEEFVSRHFNFINQKSKLFGMNIKLREVVVIEDDASQTASHHLGYVNDSIPGSDGVWVDGNTYDPNNSKYKFVDSQGKLNDIGWTHEVVWHSTLRGHDSYSLDYIDGPIPLEFESLQRTDNVWRKYYADRSDISAYCISNGGWSKDELDHGIGFGEHATLMLLSRVRSNTLHDFSDSMIDYEGWRADLPVSVNLIFSNFDGSPIETQAIKLFRTTAENQNPALKTLGVNPVFDGEARNIPISAVFNIHDQIILTNEATILIKINDTHFRWMDVRDFQIASWKGFKKPTMNMKCLPLEGSESIEKTSFDPTINYEEI